MGLKFSGTLSTQIIDYVIQKTDTTDSEKSDEIKNDILIDKRLTQITNENKYGICVTGTAAKTNPIMKTNLLLDQKGGCI